MTTKRSADTSRSISERAKQTIQAKAKTGEANGGEEKPARPVREPLPNRADVDRMIAELRDELGGHDQDTSQEAVRIMRAASARAAERVRLLVYGNQPTTTPQVNTACIAVLKAAGVVPVATGDMGAGDSSITVDTPTTE